MKAMILAAGRGKRLDPLTASTPKPLVKVADKPLLQYHIENLASIGVKEIVINTSWLGDKIESYFGNGSSFGVNIEWSREPELLDTGGGVKKALPLLGNAPFLLINSDIWSNFSLNNLLKKPLTPGIYAHLILVPNPSHNKLGDFTLSSKNKIRLPRIKNPTYTFSGISILSPEIFNIFKLNEKKFPLTDLLVKAITLDSVTGSVCDEIWCDVGTIERLSALNKILAKSR
ncbi:MAG: mannose-1-phosphate guanylyltransferase [Porticoccus sp.]|jgi:MurNAc alpha-1-phosphate uridylyltransferase|nr:mannose-1-phosphate guanylyltransferase [Porticoccus sp.]|tara:strand:- start:1504 stop:2193 length:690 start_codon:yes stop_codon:yes gene_type:complete